MILVSKFFYVIFQKMNYNHNIEDLILSLNTSKCKLAEHLKKNYKENIHYIIEQSNIRGVKGGRPKINYLVTEKTFELLKNSYNLRSRYIVNLSENINNVNNIAMCIENQTIGFIENSFKDVINIIRQYKFDKYKVDLYFPDFELVIECDEENHKNRNPIEEKTRQDFILSRCKIMLRYNPNSNNFDFSLVLKEIFKILFKKNDVNKKLILLN